jgi:hypothetical protein
MFPKSSQWVFMRFPLWSPRVFPKEEEEEEEEKEEETREGGGSK